MVEKFEVYHDGERWCARGIGTDIITCGDTLDELMEQIKDAVACRYEDELNQGKTLDILTITETEVPRGTAAATGQGDAVAALQRKLGYSIVASEAATSR